MSFCMVVTPHRKKGLLLTQQPFLSAQFRAGGDMGIQHQEMEFPFFPFHMFRAEQHPAGFDAHHLPGRQVHNGHTGLADQVFRIVVGLDAAEDDPVGAGAVVQGELEQLLALGHGGAFLDLDRAVVGLGKGVELDLLFEDRLALYLVDLVGGVRALGLDNAGTARCGGGSALRALLLGLLALLGHVERLHRREYYLGIIVTSHKFL